MSSRRTAVLPGDEGGVSLDYVEVCCTRFLGGEVRFFILSAHNQWFVGLPVVPPALLQYCRVAHLLSDVHQNVKVNSGACCVFTLLVKRLLFHAT